MRKRIHKLFAVLLAICLLFAVSIPAFAAEESDVNADALLEANPALQSLAEEFGDTAFPEEDEPDSIDSEEVLEQTEQKISSVQTSLAAIVYASTYEELVEAVADPNATVIFINNDIQLEAALNVDRTIFFYANNAEKSVVLYAAEKEWHMSVSGDEIVLNFDGVILDGNYQDDENDAGGIQSDAADLILKDAEIRNCARKQSFSSIYRGAAVSAVGNLTIYGGEIYQNTTSATTLGSVYIRRYYQLDLIDAYIHDNAGTGVCGDDYSTIIMHSGLITKNTNNGIYGYYVTLNGGEISYNLNGGISANYLYMYDGLVKGNVSEGDSGGGIVCGGGTVRIYGGTITNNTAGLGGGVAAGLLARIYITGGEITNNHATLYGGAVGSLIANQVEIENAIISGNTSDEGGGAIALVLAGPLSMWNCEVSDNHCAGDGGAVLLSDSTINIIENCNFSGNTASRGGAFFWDITFTNTEPPFNGLFSNVLLEDNEAKQQGGAIYISSEYTALECETTTIQNNKADDGAGIYILDSTVELNEDVIMFNIANQNGGGIYNAGTLTVNGAEIMDNEALYGGGVYAAEGSVTTISSGNIGFNSAYAGGGVYSLGRVTVAGGSISDNLASTTGGGIYATNLAITGGEISYNTARNGGGVYYTGSLSMLDGTITGNSATQYGGGIYGTNTSVAILFGGSITGNTARSGGDDVYSLGTVG